MMFQQFLSNFRLHIPRVASPFQGFSIPKQPENLVLDLSESSRDSTFEIGPIFIYWTDFERSNPEALAKSKFQFGRLFGYALGYNPSPHSGVFHFFYSENC